MKTPMQELIERIEKWMLDDKYVQDNPFKYEEYMLLHANQMIYIKSEFMELCKTLLDKEKEVIIDAWLDDRFPLDKDWTKQCAENYYNETFKIKEK